MFHLHRKCFHNMRSSCRIELLPNPPNNCTRKSHFHLRNFHWRISIYPHIHWYPEKITWEKVFKSGLKKFKGCLPLLNILSQINSNSKLHYRSNHISIGKKIFETNFGKLLLIRHYLAMKRHQVIMFVQKDDTSENVPTAAVKMFSYILTKIYSEQLFHWRVHKKYFSRYTDF